MNDFKDLFLELYGNKDYNKKSAKKINFYKTINTLRDFIITFNESIYSIEINTAKELKKLQEELEYLKSKSKENYNEYKNSLDKSLKDISNAKNSFFDAKRALEEENKLSSTKLYWQEKKKKHYDISKVLSFIFICLTIFLLIFVRHNIKIVDNMLIDDTNITIPIKDKIQTAKISIKYVVLHSIQSLLIISIMVWILKIILKIIFSNLHLKEEAYEKETMISTYLALIKDGGGLNDTDRGLILEIIFRPSTNGLIQDEGTLNLLDVANLLKSK